MRIIVIILITMLLMCDRSNAQNSEVLKRAALYEPLIVEAGKRHSIDPRVLWIVAYMESKFQPNAVSPVGARGMMQFMLGTAQRYKLRNPHNPVTAVNAAAQYLSDLQRLFDNRLDLMLAAYNAGEGAVIAFRDGRSLSLSNGKVINAKKIKTIIPPYKETIAYVKQGLALYIQLAGNEKGGESYAMVRERLALLEQENKYIEEIPVEINKLKQGSIYITELPKVSEKTTEIKGQFSTHSIYPRQK